MALRFIVPNVFKGFDYLACTYTFMLNQLGKENI